MRAAWSSSTTLNIVRHMARARYSREKTVEQLSSGRRINRAADDAAGLAVATSLNSRVRSLRVARTNAETAEQALQIADGGMAEIQVMLIRLKELAMQAATETVSDAERAFMQAEVGELLGAIDSAAWTSTYNGIPLLAQAHVDVAFVLDTSGSMGGEKATLVASIQAFRQAFIDAGVDVNFGLAAMRTSLDPVDGVDRVVDINGGGFEAALAGLPLAGGAIDAYSALVNVSGANDFNGDNDVFSWRQDVAHHIVVITDTGREAEMIPGDPTQAEVGADLAAEGVVVHVIAPPNQAGGYNVITGATGGSTYDLGGAAGAGIPAALDDISSNLTGGDDLLAGDPLEVQVGIHNTEHDKIDIGLAADGTVVGLGLSGTTVSTRQDALEALDAVDAAIGEASAVRATLGAAQRRLDHVVNYQSDAIENETAAQARIEDLDYASASMDMAIAQILSNASTSMLFEHLSMKREMILSIYGQESRARQGPGRGGGLNARM
jgi:flagellin